jgi:hypothetical protein
MAETLKVVPQQEKKKAGFARNSEVARNVGLLTAAGGLLMPILLLPGLLLAAVGEGARRVATTSKKEPTVIFEAKTPVTVKT